MKLQRLRIFTITFVCIVLINFANAQITTSKIKVEVTDNLTTVKSRLIWGANSDSIWGNGLLSMDAGWSTGKYPTLSSFGGTHGSLIMLHNPHIPFRIDNTVNGYSGKAGIRMASDENVSAYWDAGLAGDFYHIYRSGSGEFLRITNSGFIGIGVQNPSEKLEISGKLKWGENSNADCGNGILSMDSGWKLGIYPTIGSSGGDSGSLIMLHNPHIPFRTDNKVNGYSGKAGIRMASDENASTYWDAGLAGDFYHIYRCGGGEFLRVTSNGDVGIGTDNPNYKLEVNGAIKGLSFHSNTNSWSDFVFENDYKLRSLEEIEKFIIKNKHLPDIPKESEVLEKGINLAEMDAKLLQKIEELILYLIKQNKLNKTQQEKIEQLEIELNSLKKELKIITRVHK